MSFPVTINAGIGAAEQPGKFATFLHGTDRYQIQFVVDNVDTGTAQLKTYKSTDTGATWALVDSGGGPTALAGLGFSVPYSCVQSSATVLRVVYLDSSATIRVTTFTMGTDTWGGAGTAASAPTNSMVSGEDGFPLQQIATGYRSSDGSVIAVIVGDFAVTLGSVLHAICAFAVYSIGGDSWGSWTTMGFTDYSDIATWDMVPCGIAVDSGGRSTVLMQQICRAGPGNMAMRDFNVGSTFIVPDDAPTSAFLQMVAAGGGSGGDPTQAGSGGGGGEYREGPITIAPAGSYPITVGVGGAVLADGTISSAFGITANPGLAGTTDTTISGNSPGGAGGSGGSGGTAHNNGGAGGNSGTGMGIHTGGGGGGAGDQNGAGGAGTQGGLTPTMGVPSNYFGGSGGQSGNTPAGVPFAGTGGAGGGRGADGMPNSGFAGSGPGVGGGGQGDSSDLGANAGVGNDGLVMISFQLVRNTHACRLFQQAIKSDNSLGAIAEITEGAFPARAHAAAPVPISFDIAIAAGELWISFTGATSTTGRDDIAVGKGATADVVSFSFQTFSAGNSSSNVDACPALAIGGGKTYCCYMSTPTAGPAAFVYRTDSGSGFGAPFTIGSLTLPDDREFGRLQATVLATLPEITFGTPTQGVVLFSEPS